MAKQSKAEIEAAEERSKLLGQARQAATSRIVNEHREAFEQAYVEEAQARGVDYQPRPSKEQRALEQARALLAEHPSLRDELLAE